MNARPAWLSPRLAGVAGVAVMAILAAVFAWGRPARPSPAVVLAAPNAFSGPVQGGCYLDTPVQCRIHIDSFQPVVTDQGTKLVGVQLAALREESAAFVTLYDFRTDVSNPPSGSYTLSRVRQDYAADCGVTYVLALLVRDTGDLNFEQVGQTNAFTCPAAATPTATPSPTATATPSPTATPSSAATPSPTSSPTPTGTPGATPPPGGWALYLPSVLGE